MHSSAIIPATYRPKLSVFAATAYSNVYSDFMINVSGEVSVKAIQSKLKRFSVQKWVAFSLMIVAVTMFCLGVAGLFFTNPLVESIGSIIPILILTYGYSYLYNYFKGELFGNFITLVKPNPFIFNVSGVLLIIGIVVGMFGSRRAVRKYLKI